MATPETQQSTSGATGAAARSSAPCGGSTSYSVRVGRLAYYSIEWREHSRHKKQDDAAWMEKYLRLVKGKDFVEVYQVTETEMSNDKLCHGQGGKD
jgi:hypothetical protein